MKLHFESDLPYQAAAIEAVCDLFRGQEVCRSVFTVTAQAQADSGQQSFEGKQFTAQGGIGNRSFLTGDVAKQADTHVDLLCCVVVRKFPQLPSSEVIGSLISS